MTCLRNLLNLHLNLFYIPTHWPLSNMIQIRSHIHKEINKINTLTKNRREFKKMSGLALSYFWQTNAGTVRCLLYLSCQQYPYSLSLFFHACDIPTVLPLPPAVYLCIVFSYHLPNLHSKMACPKRLPLGKGHSKFSYLHIISLRCYFGESYVD